MVKIYCSTCGKYQSMRIDEMHKDKDGTIWGDICCEYCHLIIATIEVEREGIYEFKRISQIEESSNEYLCSVCHQTPIDVENGFDTCDACAKKI